MKITKEYLQQIIKEELEALIQNEATGATPKQQEVLDMLNQAQNLISDAEDKVQATKDAALERHMRKIIDKIQKQFGSQASKPKKPSMMQRLKGAFNEEEKKEAVLNEEEVRIHGARGLKNGRDVYYMQDKSDERDAGQRPELSIESQRDHCRDRSKSERVHFNERTKRCEYDYLNEE